MAWRAARIRFREKSGVSGIGSVVLLALLLGGSAAQAQVPVPDPRVILIVHTVPLDVATSVLMTPGQMREAAAMLERFPESGAQVESLALSATTWLTVTRQPLPGRGDD
jgi:hypothetical protein